MRLKENNSSLTAEMFSAIIEVVFTTLWQILFPEICLEVRMRTSTGGTAKQSFFYSKYTTVRLRVFDFT